MTTRVCGCMSVFNRRIHVALLTVCVPVCVPVCVCAKVSVKVSPIVQLIHVITIHRGAVTTRNDSLPVQAFLRVNICRLSDLPVLSLKNTCNKFDARRKCSKFRSKVRIKNPVLLASVIYSFLAGFS